MMTWMKRVEFFVNVRVKGYPISGSMLQKVLAVASNLGIAEFKASNGWPGVMLAIGLIELPFCVMDTICVMFSVLMKQGYFIDIPNKSLVLKGDKCKGGKNPRSNLVLLCCSATGKWLKPLIVGHTQQNCTLKVIKIDTFTVTWKFNPLTPYVNCHVKVQFLPPNLISESTSRSTNYQTGEINYRKLLLRKLLLNCEGVQSVFAVLNITVLDAIQIISEAWKSASTSTFNLCFKQVGF